MLLYDAGRVMLDEPVEKYIPGFASGGVFVHEGTTKPCVRPCTIRDLLSHTAGLTYDSGMGLAKGFIAELYDKTGLF